LTKWTNWVYGWTKEPRRQEQAFSNAGRNQLDQGQTELSYPMTRSAPFNPPDDYADLREREPFARVRLWDGTHPYLLTKYADIRAVLSNPRFSCEPNREGFPHVFEGRMVADKADRSFLRLDNPEHDRLRRMVTREFTVKKIEQLKPLIQETVDRLITTYTSLPQGADLVEHFSGPLPTEIITFLLGIPYQDHEFFHEATRIQFGSKSTPAQVRKSLDDLFAYLDALMRRAAIDAVGGFENAFRGMFEDQVLFAKIMLRSPVYVAGNTWAKYRQHPTSASAGVGFWSAYWARLAYLKWLASYMKAHSISEPTCRRVVARVRWSELRELIRIEIRRLKRALFK